MDDLYHAVSLAVRYGPPALVPVPPSADKDVVWPAACHWAIAQGIDPAKMLLIRRSHLRLYGISEELVKA